MGWPRIKSRGSSSARRVSVPGERTVTLTSQTCRGPGGLSTCPAGPVQGQAHTAQSHFPGGPWHFSSASPLASQYLPQMRAGHPNANNKAVSLLLVCVNGLDPDKSRKKIGVPGLGTERGMAGAPRPAGSSRVWGRDGIENPQGASGRHLPSLCSPLQVSQGGSETPVFPAGLTERPPLQSQRLSWRTGARVDARPTCGHQWPETPREGRQVSRRPHRSMAAQDRAAPTPPPRPAGPLTHQMSVFPPSS